MLRVRSTSVRLALVLVAVLLGPSSAAGAADLGPNVRVFDPSMPVSQIQATVDAIHARQVDDEMGSNRYLLLFKPGTYGSGVAALP